MSKRNLVTTNETPFDSYYAPNANEAHVSLTACSAMWITNEINNLPQPTVGPSYMIGGSPELCITSQEYNFQGIPSGATVVWNITPATGIASLSTTGNTATLTQTGNGNITLTATVNSCGTITLSRPIKVGTPVLGMPNFTNLDNENQYWCSNNSGNSFTIETNDLSATYEARILSYPSLNVYATNSNAYPGGDTFGYVPAGYYVFQLRATNICGTSDWVETEVESLDCSLNYKTSNLNIYPNPANAELTVEFKDSEHKVANRTLQLIDNKGTILSASKLVSGQSKAVLNTKEMPNGIYYLHVANGKETVKKQIIIKH